MATRPTEPWLSVLIPTYNGEKYLPFTLNSIIEQGDPDIECIVIDDGSTDSTNSILDNYQDELPLIILRRKRQGNWVANTNYALTIAKGKFVCFLHQDDLWFKNRLAIMKNLIGEFPDAGFFLHPSYFLDSNGQKLGTWTCPLHETPQIIKPDQMIEKLLVQNFISIPAPVFRGDFATKVNGLDQELWYTADWDFWLKIAREGDTVYFPEPLSGFRVHSASQTLVRSSSLPDLRNQLEYVFKKHYDVWEYPIKRKLKIGKIAIFSINMNVSLAGFIHNKSSTVFKLLVDFLLLGPYGWYLYFQNSRILERVTARLKAQLINKPSKTF